MTIRITGANLPEVLDNLSGEVGDLTHELYSALNTLESTEGSEDVEELHEAIGLAVAEIEHALNQLI